MCERTRCELRPLIPVNDGVAVRRRWSTAMPSALVTSAVLGLELIDQPTTLRGPGEATPLSS